MGWLLQLQEGQVCRCWLVAAMNHGLVRTTSSNTTKVVRQQTRACCCCCCSRGGGQLHSHTAWQCLLVLLGPTICMVGSHQQYRGTSYTSRQGLLLLLLCAQQVSQWTRHC
jgi:hypothetical protein